MNKFLMKNGCLPYQYIDSNNGLTKWLSNASETERCMLDEGGAIGVRKRANQNVNYSSCCLETGLE